MWCLIQGKDYLTSMTTKIGWIHVCCDFNICWSIKKTSIHLKIDFSSHKMVVDATQLEFHKLKVALVFKEQMHGGYSTVVNMLVEPT